ncbi:MAG: Spy/CpxP family protein refolding chaperone [Pseudomonadota bacterium]|nr:Spy/CpxP family protein refolding chaperone [Pseudomonadota bacterium]
MKLGKRTIIVITGGALLIGGVVACNRGMHCGSPEERGEWMVKKVSKELELNETQRVKLVEVKDEFLDVRKTMRSDRQQTRADVLAMLKQPTLDREKVNTIVGQHIATINTRSPAIIDAIGNFYDSLDDSQRAELREFIEHKMDHRGRRHWD